MIGNLEPEENVLQWFEQTSNEPYNRHDYKLVYVNGNHKVFDNHEDFMAMVSMTANNASKSRRSIRQKNKKEK
jgi:hypothetical protein